MTWKEFKDKIEFEMVDKGLTEDSEIDLIDVDFKQAEAIEVEETTSGLQVY